MHTLLPLPCLAAVGEYIPFFGMLIPITLFLVLLTIVIVSLYFKNQSRKMWHETARIALEKGQPIPLAPSALSPKIEEALGKRLETENRTSSRNDVKAGLILIAISVGLYFGLKDGTGGIPGMPSSVYYVPGFIGVALLINAVISFLLNRKKTETPSSRPPQA